MPAAAPSSQPWDRPAAGAGPARILVADDQPSVLEALRLLLKGEGHQTELVTGPEGVMDRLQSGDFDLVLLDLNYTRDTTSGSEGLDLLSRIRARDPNLPIVVMTAWSSVDLAVEAMQRGACDFLQKPWDNARVLSLLRTHVQRYRMLQQKNRIWEEEVNAAAGIQRNLLPHGTLKTGGCAIASAYLPARFVGGDYFDVVEIAGETALCIADVSGKGVPAALLMANLQATLKPQMAKGVEPAEVCREMNRLIGDATAPGRFVSLCHVVLRPAAGSLLYCNAGHVPPVLIHPDGTSCRLLSEDAVLGTFPDWQYRQKEARLLRGSRLLLYTDGIVEACNTAGEEFGEERLTGLAVENRELGAEQMKRKILSAVMAHCENRPQDDATLLVIAVD
jgi:sigma-B regulation protein RsbU (phosphoserine phosphatase)